MNISPCAPDCSERSATCHGVCRIYLDYFKEREEERKEKQRKWLGNAEAVTGGNYLDYREKCHTAPKRFIHK